MAYITPNSDVILCKGVPLDKDYNHTLYNADSASQYSAISYYQKYSLSALTYQRYSKNSIRVEKLADLLYDCNYMMFRNTAYGSKWFYAFITDIMYVNDNCTQITYEIDVMQTWYFDYEMGQCFVEREHSETDYIGENLVPEELEIGELNVQRKIDYLFPRPAEGTPPVEQPSSYAVVLYVPNAKFVVKWSETETPGSGQEKLYGGWIVQDFTTSQIDTIASRGDIYCGVYSGCSYIAVAMYSHLVDGDTLPRRQLNSLMLTLNTIEANIVSIVQVPSTIWENWSTNRLNPPSGYTPISPVQITTSIAQQNIFYMPDHRVSNTYVAKNRKLLSYPYQSIIVSNNSGNTGQIRWENFATEDVGRTLKTATFMIEGVPIPSPEMSAYPTDYRGLSNDYENGVVLNDFPYDSWSEESMRTWWASAREGIVAGTISGSVMGLKDGLVAFAKAHHTPDQIGGQVSTSSLRTSQKRVGYSFYCMAITSERAKIIDNYFTQYGYAVKQVKYPNIHRTGARLRPHWNYLKTQNAILHGMIGASTGGLPADAEAEISRIYNKGITFWNRLDEIGNYALNNDPI